MNRRPQESANEHVPQETEKDTPYHYKRSPRACNQCRARKVRCDAMVRQKPCTNCYLDKNECIVTSVKRNLQQKSVGNMYNDLKECQILLDAWYSAAPVRNMREFGHNPTFLQVSLMHVYYHTATLALNQYSASCLEFNPHLRCRRPEVDLTVAKARVRRAISELTQIFFDIRFTDMTAFLQLGAAAYITLPFIATSLDFRLTVESSNIPIRKRKLVVFEDIVECLQSRFDNVELVNRTMEKAIELCQHSLTSPSNQPETSSAGLPLMGNGGDDAIYSNFRLYAILFVYVDLVLSKGRLPSDTEFAQKVQHLIHGICQMPDDNEVSDKRDTIRGETADWDSLILYPEYSASTKSTDSSQNLSLQVTDGGHYNLDQLDGDLTLFLAGNLSEI